MRFKILMMAVLAGTALAGAQDWDDPTLDGRMSCTSIMVGKKASTDGSVMTSHTCDGNYRTWVDIVPGYTNDKDTTVAVYTGRMHTDLSTGTRGMEKVGEIPDVRQTYRFVNTAYPCLNEKQLGIGETTISGRSELRNKKGLFY
ncbi:MAG: C69 family dipeptidase, partial [Muribaculaceae bacterium]|nr:C69 family dipeptidase [Muribaculaceae bacterium]